MKFSQTPLNRGEKLQPGGTVSGMGKAPTQDFSNILLN